LRLHRTNPREVALSIWTKSRAFSPGADDSVSGIDKTAFFSLRDKADYGVKVASAVRGGSKLLMEFDALRIVSPDVFDFDRRADAFGRTVGQAILLNVERFGYWPLEASQRFLDIRKRYSRWLEAPDEVDPVVLLDDIYLLLTGAGLFPANGIGNFLRNYDAAQADQPAITLGGAIG
jgi:hypothetical protein